jgi:hypothetical protein
MDAKHHALFTSALDGYEFVAELADRLGSIKLWIHGFSVNMRYIACKY